MIELSSTTEENYSYLASPPTHAMCVSVNAAYQPWEGGIRFLKLNYHFGTYASTSASTSAFTPNYFIPIKEITFPSVEYSIPVASQTAYLENLFGAGVIPDPSNPIEAAAMPAKKTFDWKIKDIETIVISAIPDLNGTYVEI